MNIVVPILVVLVALFIIDLAPLQQNTVCPGLNYTNRETCPEEFFSQDYFQARAKFRKGAKALGAELESHIVTECCGVEYTIDVATIPGGNPEKLLVHMSGVHGVEGYTGSAIQTKLLQTNEALKKMAEASKDKKNNNPTIVFIHSVNPYGMAKFARFNENNVDLNRNHATSEEERKTMLDRDPNLAGYETLSSLIKMDRPPGLMDRYTFLLKAMWHILNSGMTAVKRALVSGQYHDSKGLFYGGSEKQKSIELLEKFMKKYTDDKKIKQVRSIDVHTGLGAHATHTLFVRNPEQGKTARAEFPGEPVTSNGDEDGVGDGYELLSGDVSIPKLFDPKVDALEVNEEFGTQHGIFVVRALILHNAALQHAKGTYVHTVTKEWLRDAFYPQTFVYKKETLRLGEGVFDRALKNMQKE